eukprot:366449-Chlamydomonas_euryale.AAC.27
MLPLSVVFCSAAVCVFCSAAARQCVIEEILRHACASAPPHKRVHTAPPPTAPSAVPARCLRRRTRVHAARAATRQSPPPSSRAAPPRPQPTPPRATGTGAVAADPPPVGSEMSRDRRLKAPLEPQHRVQSSVPDDMLKRHALLHLLLASLTRYPLPHTFPTPFARAR